MKRLLKVLMVWLCRTTLTAAACAAHAEPITVLTTEFPPYSFSSKGQLAGLSTEVVKAVLTKARIQTDAFKVYPWARAFTLAKGGRNMLIYSIARSPERDTLFQWVGPLAPYHVNFYKLRNRSDIDIETVEQAKLYLVGGEYRDIKQLYLKSIGFEEEWNIEMESTAELNIRKLFAGRIDLLPVSETNLPYLLRAEGLRIDDVEKVLPLAKISNPLYMAFSLDVPTEVVARAARALQQLSEEGVIQKIYESYMK